MSEFNLTINKASKALGIDPRTLKKRAEAVNLSPADGRGGFAKYYLGDLARAAFTNAREETVYDVERLSPKDRNQHYLAEQNRVKLGEMESELIPYDEAAERYAELAKSFSTFFDTLLDDVEQEGLFTPEQLELLQEYTDGQRRLFASKEF